MYRPLTLAFLLVIFSSDTLRGQVSYQEEIENYRKDRLTSLTAAQSWSSLQGLYWLSKDTTSIGPNEHNDIHLPQLERNKDKYVFKKEGELIYHDFDYKDYILKEHVVFSKENEASKITDGQYIWTVIEREGKKGVRVWDTLHPNRNAIAMLPQYAIDPIWKVEARFKAYDSLYKQGIPNVLGMNIDYHIPGELSFTIDGKEHTLLALEADATHYFLIFSDHTTGDTTYGGGRYLYCPRENAEGLTIIDFNKAFTPPCGFTTYATCLLPLPENKLDIAIEAGEKYDDHH